MQETAVSNLLEKPAYPTGIRYSVPFRITKIRRKHPARHDYRETASEIEVPVASLPDDEVIKSAKLIPTLAKKSPSLIHGLKIGLSIFVGVRMGYALLV